MMRLLGVAAVTVAVASLLWTSERVAGQAAPPGERRNLIGVWELVSLQDNRPNGDVLDWLGKKPSGSTSACGKSTSARTRLRITFEPASVQGGRRTLRPALRALRRSASAAVPSERGR